MHQMFISSISYRINLLICDIPKIYTHIKPSIQNYSWLFNFGILELYFLLRWLTFPRFALFLYAFFHFLISIFVLFLSLYFHLFFFLFLLFFLLDFFLNWLRLILRLLLDLIFGLWRNLIFRGRIFHCLIIIV